MNKIYGNVVGGSIVTQSDWNQTDATKADYIKNKPTSVIEHAHNDLYYTKKETDSRINQVANNAQLLVTDLAGQTEHKLAGKSDKNHNHDGEYYTTTDINNIVSEATQEIQAANTRITSLENTQNIHTDFIADLFTERSATLDKVTAIGTEGEWNYRAWDSGVIECWGDVKAVVTSNAPDVEPFSTIVCRLDLPSVVTEATEVTFTSKEVSLFAAYAYTNIIPTTHAISIGLKGFTSVIDDFATNETVSVNVHLFGKWNTGDE